MIYVVIPNYILDSNLETLAKNAIASFKKYDTYVIAVDDNSPYSTQCLKGADLVVRRVENGGFAKAMNSGLRIALEKATEDDLIVAANNDIEVSGNWVEEAHKCFDLHKADMVGGLGFRCKNIPDWNDERISEGGQFADWMFPGGFFITKRKLWDDCGLYDENYEHGGIEDIDLFYLAKEKGKRLIMTPKIKYWHEEGATRYSSTQRGKQNDKILKNEAYFKDKYGFHPVQKLHEILICNYLNP